MNVRRSITRVIHLLSGAVGILAFIYPFFTPAAAARHGMGRRLDAPLVTAALVGLSVVALLVELQGRSLSAKTVAMLGVLVALTSVLRFLEVAFPMPGGFSPIFAPIIIAGYVFGGRFGFLMGTFTLLASALITGGVGPWLPYQMFTAGWAGLTAGWLRGIPNLGLGTGRGRRRSSGFTFHATANTQRVTRSSILILCAFGFIWGLLYGAIINVYFWPFAIGPAEQAWVPGIGLGEIMARYGAFYAVTSLAWDLARAVGNVALILVLGVPMIKALERFRRRFNFAVEVRESPPLQSTDRNAVEVEAHA
ncbi:MAG: ECF transporter S component [Anaerolineae bacterium]|jgi:energy-coupling factor transport system substrate-specific component